MGKSDAFVKPFYDNFVKPVGDVALLGYNNNNWWPGDLYDLSLGNWDINSDWKLDKKYDSIICTRVAYFCKDLESFFVKCKEHLNPGGKLYVDFGLGDHWRFYPYKIGWVDKNGQQEYAYDKANKLWSTVWDDDFEVDNEFMTFSKNVERFGYEYVKDAIKSEVPVVLDIDDVRKYFKVDYHLLTLWTDNPQLYILLECTNG